MVFTCPISNISRSRGFTSTPTCHSNTIPQWQPVKQSFHNAARNAQMSNKTVVRGDTGDYSERKGSGRWGYLGCSVREWDTGSLCHQETGHSAEAFSCQGCNYICCYKTVFLHLPESHRNNWIGTLILSRTSVTKMFQLVKYQMRVVLKYTIRKPVLWHPRSKITHSSANKDTLSLLRTVVRKEKQKATWHKANKTLHIDMCNLQGIHLTFN